MLKFKRAYSTGFANAIPPGQAQIRAHVRHVPKGLPRLGRLRRRQARQHQQAGSRPRHVRQTGLSRRRLHQEQVSGGAGDV
ncbi:uncharacterized protein TrAtP1_011768 [Trichoderma atroviride]|uniref:uncharacterized protein n=1 Tax=Hypocrea atroviridis TaxID=63577 RepID=UPI0033168B2C|nr:hypothetical protein TrAtP1_011768 [Trichoderma atroviride]